MVTPAKRKREEVTATGKANGVSIATPHWPELLQAIKGDKGEHGAVIGIRS